MEQSHRADRIVGQEFLKNVVAVGQPLGENLEDLAAQSEDGVVVFLGRILHHRRGKLIWENIGPEEQRVLLGTLIVVWYILPNVEPLRGIGHQRHSLRQPASCITNITTTRRDR